MFYGILPSCFKYYKVFKYKKKKEKKNFKPENSHIDPLFKILTLFTVNDIFKPQELTFCYKYKNKKLAHHLQSLPFHTNTRTHDHDTRIKLKTQPYW